MLSNNVIIFQTCLLQQQTQFCYLFLSLLFCVILLLYWDGEKIVYRLKAFSYSWKIENGKKIEGGGVSTRYKGFLSWFNSLHWQRRWNLKLQEQSFFRWKFSLKIDLSTRDQKWIYFCFSIKFFVKYNNIGINFFFFWGTKLKNPKKRKQQQTFSVPSDKISYFLLQQFRKVFSSSLFPAFWWSSVMHETDLVVNLMVFVQRRDQENHESVMRIKFDRRKWTSPCPANP